jgi:hypothetical protein
MVEVIELFITGLEDHRLPPSPTMFTIHHLNINDIRPVWPLRTLVLAVIMMRIQTDFSNMTHLPVIS